MSEIRMWKVGWARDDGSFKSFMSVPATNEAEAKAEAERQLNRPGRIQIWRNWVDRGSQVEPK